MTRFCTQDPPCSPSRDRCSRDSRTFTGISASKGRRHNQHPDCFSVNHIELEVRFGRGRFDQLNVEYDLFVTRGKHRPGSTTAYRWTAAFNDAMQACLHDFNRDVGVTTRLVQPDGTTVRNRPREPVTTKSDSD